jgi:hypothetical protein
MGCPEVRLWRDVPGKSAAGAAGELVACARLSPQSSRTQGSVQGVIVRVQDRSPPAILAALRAKILHSLAPLWPVSAA